VLFGSAGLPAGDCANAGAAITVAATAAMVIIRIFMSLPFLNWSHQANRKLAQRFPKNFPSIGLDFAQRLQKHCQKRTAFLRILQCDFLTRMHFDLD
jgi:hypothetical protein